LPRTLVTKVTRGGQISLPAEARAVLGVQPGDKVYVIVENGEVKVVKPKYAPEEVFGKLPHPRPGLSIDQMIRDGMEDWADEQMLKMQTGRG
jgi:AbrB family looped-hinge helix DNA binding protein